MLDFVDAELGLYGTGRICDNFWVRFNANQSNLSPSHPPFPHVAKTDPPYLDLSFLRVEPTVPDLDSYMLPSSIQFVFN